MYHNSSCTRWYLGKDIQDVVFHKFHHQNFDVQWAKDLLDLTRVREPKEIISGIFFKYGKLKKKNSVLTAVHLTQICRSALTANWNSDEGTHKAERCEHVVHEHFIILALKESINKMQQNVSTYALRGQILLQFPSPHTFRSHKLFHWNQCKQIVLFPICGVCSWRTVSVNSDPWLE